MRGMLCRGYCRWRLCSGHTYAGQILVDYIFDVSYRLSLNHLLHFLQVECFVLNKCKSELCMRASASGSQAIDIGGTYPVQLLLF
jgi:hypothetical protein